jgi:hypothetical protein
MVIPALLLYFSSEWIGSEWNAPGSSDVDLLGRNVNIRKNTETLLEASLEVSLERNAEKCCMCLCTFSRLYDRITVRETKSLLKMWPVSLWLVTTVETQNYVYGGTKSRINLDNVYCDLALNLLSCSVLQKTSKIKMQSAVISSVALCRWELDVSVFGKNTENRSCLDQSVGENKAKDVSRGWQISIMNNLVICVSFRNIVEMLHSWG